MALTPEQSDALIREVDDAVRQDDFYSFWSRYGRVIAIAVGLGLAGFGGWLFWQNQQHKSAEAASEQFATLLKSASSAKLDQESLDKLEKSKSEGYSAEAELVKAAIAAGKDDLKTAVASYDKLHGNANAPESIRELALIRRTALEFDTMKPQAVIDALADLAQPGNPWFGSAGEMTALAYLKMDKKREAGEMFAAINQDASVTESIRQRTGQMATMLGVSPGKIVQLDQEGN